MTPIQVLLETAHTGPVIIDTSEDQLTCIDTSLIGRQKAKNDDPLSLTSLQTIVEGYIELVAVLGDRSLWLIVNEEGLLLGKQRNPRASMLAEQLIVGTTILLQRSLID